MSLLFIIFFSQSYNNSAIAYILMLLSVHYRRKYEGPAKSFVTGFGLLQCYVLSKNIFITNLQSIPLLLKHIFVTFLPSREKQINSLLLVSVGETDN